MKQGNFLRKQGSENAKTGSVGTDQGSGRRASARPVALSIPTGARTRRILQRSGFVCCFYRSTSSKWAQRCIPTFRYGALSLTATHPERVRVRHRPSMTLYKPVSGGCAGERTACAFTSEVQHRLVAIATETNRSNSLSKTGARLPSCMAKAARSGKYLPLRIAGRRRSPGNSERSG